jgi:c-di-GMP-binding flagellar brake protein YcgR
MRNERRRSPRAAERIAMTVTEDRADLRAETNNLSASGAYCTLDRFIAPMTKLHLQFALPNGSHNTTIRCSAVVVRVEPLIANAQRGRYHVALFFTDLSDRHRSAITRFVQRRIQASAGSTS